MVGRYRRERRANEPFLPDDPFLTALTSDILIQLSRLPEI
jgi:hypothetical protein